jgi:hypothetical protein
MTPNAIPRTDGTALAETSQENTGIIIAPNPMEHPAAIL